MKKTDLPAPPLFTVSSDHPESVSRAINATDSLDAARLYLANHHPHFENMDVYVTVHDQAKDRDTIFDAYSYRDFPHASDHIITHDGYDPSFEPVRNLNYTMRLYRHAGWSFYGVFVEDHEVPFHKAMAMFALRTDAEDYMEKQNKSFIHAD